MEEVVAGIDEAGRGSVIGPMVIAGVSFRKEGLRKLRTLGVKDSKLLSPARRETLAASIEELANDVVVVKVSACKIDSLRNGGVNLNRLEAMKFADILGLLGATTAYIDNPNVNPKRLAKILAKGLDGASKLVVEHKADHKYPVVSAASIVAKVERDREVKSLHGKYGDFGPGYSSNPRTIAWMQGWIGKNREWPDIVRKTWDTAVRMKAIKSQRSIGGFFRRGK